MEITTTVLEERGAQKSQGHMVRLSYVILTERVRGGPAVKERLSVVSDSSWPHGLYSP